METEWRVIGESGVNCNSFFQTSVMSRVLNT